MTGGGLLGGRVVEPKLLILFLTHNKKGMKRRINYVAPEIELLEVTVECGFATSPDVPDYDYGGDLTQE